MRRCENRKTATFSHRKELRKGGFVFGIYFCERLDQIVDERIQQGCHQEDGEAN